MSGSRLAACFSAVVAVLAQAEDAEEVIGELYMGPARTDHPHWEPIYRKRSAPQPVRKKPYCKYLQQYELLLVKRIRSAREF